jgi:hypothetical protein
MRFEDRGLSPLNATQRGPDAPQRPGDRQNEVGVHASVQSAKASETPDAAVSIEMFVDELGDRAGAGPSIPPQKSRPAPPAGAESSISCQPPRQPTKKGCLDTDMTSVRGYWNTDAPDERATRVAGPQARAALKDLSGYTGQRLHLLSAPRIRIGRRSDAENTAGPGITIKCLCVSRNHALIERQDRSYWITDLGSVNGTYVNNERVSGQRCLHDGDTVRVARYEFEFTSATELLRSA